MKPNIYFGVCIKTMFVLVRNIENLGLTRSLRKAFSKVYFNFKIIVFLLLSLIIINK